VAFFYNPHTGGLTRTDVRVKAGWERHFWGKPRLASSLNSQSSVILFPSILILIYCLMSSHQVFLRHPLCLVASDVYHLPQSTSPLCPNHLNLALTGWQAPIPIIHWARFLFLSYSGNPNIHLITLVSFLSSFCICCSLKLHLTLCDRCCSASFTADCTINAAIQFQLLYYENVKLVHTLASA